MRVRRKNEENLSGPSALSKENPRHIQKGFAELTTSPTITILAEIAMAERPGLFKTERGERVGERERGREEGSYQGAGEKRSQTVRMLDAGNCH